MLLRCVSVLSSQCLNVFYSVLAVPPWVGVLATTHIYTLWFINTNLKGGWQWGKAPFFKNVFQKWRFLRQDGASNPFQKSLLLLVFCAVYVWTLVPGTFTNQSPSQSIRIGINKSVLMQFFAAGKDNGFYMSKRQLTYFYCMSLHEWERLSNDWFLLKWGLGKVVDFKGEDNFVSLHYCQGIPWKKQNQESVSTKANL